MAVAEEVSDRVLTLTLDRPEKKNAITLAMYEQLGAALSRAASDAAIRAIVLRGAGGIYTAGNDVGDFVPSSFEPDAAPARFVDAMIAAEKPILAAVEGIAIGIGVTTLLHCDLVYAAEGTRFQLPFTKLGLCPEAASSYLLPRICGHRRAAELLLLGEVFGPDQARESGLVTRVVPPADLYPTVRERAQTLATLPPASVRATKRLLRQGVMDGIRASADRELTCLVKRIVSPEAAEAFAAFKEKRQPDFSRFE